MKKGSCEYVIWGRKEIYVGGEKDKKRERGFFFFSFFFFFVLFVFYVRTGMMAPFVCVCGFVCFIPIYRLNPDPGVGAPKVN